MKRTPDAGVVKFELRPGTESVPRLGGMSRLGDTAQIPPNQFHLLVNTRFAPGELASRPGLTEFYDLGEEACITGLIEASENTGGGVVNGLLTGYTYTQGPVGLYTSPCSSVGGGNARNWFYLHPEEDALGVDGAARALIVQELAGGDSLWIPESYFPLKGVRSHYWSSRGCGPSGTLTGPLHPFQFQGNTCILGTLGYTPPYILILGAIVAPDDQGPGAVNQIARFGNYYPVSSCVRREVVSGAVIEVLYFSTTNNQILRFDGTTLSLWFDATLAGFVPHYWRLFCSGTEILIIGSHQNGTTVTGSPTLTPDFFRDVMLYQAWPEAPINACTFDVSIPYFSQDPAEQANRAVTFSGACRWRDGWYVTLESSPGAMHAGAVIPYGQMISAPSGGLTLHFNLEFAPGLSVIGDYTDGAKKKDARWMAWPTVHKDRLFFFSLAPLLPFADGTCAIGINSDPGTDPLYHVGNYDGVTPDWDAETITGPGGAGAPTPGDYFDSTDMAWMISNGDELWIKGTIVGGPGGIRTFINKSQDGLYWPLAEGYWRFWVESTLTGLSIPGVTVGAHSVYFVTTGQDEALEA